MSSPSAVGEPRALAVALLALRLTLAAFFLVWSLEKLIAPEQSQRVFAAFYFSEPSLAAIRAMGVAQTALALAFAAGVLRTWSYGLVLVLHALSTLSTWERLLAPYSPPNHLFWAAVPVLGALVALFLLRAHDRLWRVPLGH